MATGYLGTASISWRKVPVHLRYLPTLAQMGITLSDALYCCKPRGVGALDSAAAARLKESADRGTRYPRGHAAVLLAVAMLARDRAVEEKPLTASPGSKKKRLSSPPPASGPSRSGTRSAPKQDLSHPSVSTVQLEAESIIRQKVIEEVGKGLIPAEVAFGAGASVRVDGVAEDRSVFVEIFAHQGKLKGGQQKKVGLDALKLITLRRTHREARLILAFADEAAASYVLGKGWLAEALKAWGVEVLVVELDEIERAKIRAAQAAQEMRNVGSVS